MTERAWILPVLLVANGLLGLAVADRAAVLRRSWQTWEVRMEVQGRLKHLSNEQKRGPRPSDAPLPTEPPPGDAMPSEPPP